MLAEATGSLEPMALEHRHGAVVKKRGGDRRARTAVMILADADARRLSENSQSGLRVLR
jgi:leucyl aminopeptidase (aminopeptidase T)